MKVRTFTAGSMAAALALVKKELGASAVILHTRTVKRGGIMGLGARTVVELTASDAEEVVRYRRRPARAESRPAPVSPVPSAGDLIRRTYAAARAELSQAAATVVAPPPTDADASRLADELASVRRMVARMMRQQRERVAFNTRNEKGQFVSKLGHDLPDRLFDQYLALLEHEVTDELAEEIVQHVREKLGPDQLGDESAVRAAVLDAVAKLIPTDAAGGQVQPTTDGRPRIIALIGPTGVGKTTTVAKLAATFRLKQGKRVGLITLDTYRIAAVDQLKTYANIIGVPLRVVTTPAELRDALTGFQNCDVVLIDTAGRSQRDDPKLQQLDALIRAADPHEVHLVLSSTASQTVLLETAERFSRIRTDRIIFTKLDEAVSFGVLLNVARKVNKQLSYVTTGQEVPHQIEPGCPKRLASLVVEGRRKRT